MKNVFKFLVGKRTHITAFFTALINFLAVMEIVSLSPDQLIAINSMFGALIAMFVRLGIKNSEKKVDGVATNAANLAEDMLNLRQQAWLVGKGAKKEK